MYENSVHLIGFLGSDVQSRTTRDDVPLTVLSLATKRSWRNNQGGWDSHTDWHRVTCFGALGQFATTLKKGAHIFSTRYLRSREIEKIGSGRGKKAEPTEKYWRGKFAPSALPNSTAPPRKTLPPTYPPKISPFDSHLKGLADRAGPSFRMFTNREEVPVETCS